MTNKANKWVKEQRSRQIEKFGGVCWAKECKETKELEFAHKKGFEKTYNDNGNSGRGRKERITEIRLYPKRFLLLCKEHHRQYDEYGSLIFKDGLGYCKELALNNDICAFINCKCYFDIGYKTCIYGVLESDWQIINRNLVNMEVIK